MHEQHDNGGRFVFQQQGLEAELVYRKRDGGSIVIEHTGVDPGLRGTGAGRAVIQEAVEWARGQNLKILPVCSYARKVLDATPEYADVLVRG